MNPGTSARNTSGMLNASQQPDEAGRLVGGVDEQRAGEVGRVVGDDADRVPVEAGEPDDQLAGEQRLDLEEAVAVDDPVDHRVHVERHPLVGRHDVGRQLDGRRLGLVHRRLAAPRAREVA